MGRTCTYDSQDIHFNMTPYPQSAYYVFSPTTLLPVLIIYMGNTSYHSGALDFTPCFWWGPCCSSIYFSELSFLIILFVFVLRLVCLMLPVSLDCLFFIVPLVVSNVYLPQILLSKVPFVDIKYERRGTPS